MIKDIYTTVCNILSKFQTFSIEFMSLIWREYNKKKRYHYV